MVTNLWGSSFTTTMFSSSEEISASSTDDPRRPKFVRKNFSENSCFFWFVVEELFPDDSTRETRLLKLLLSPFKLGYERNCSQSVIVHSNCKWLTWLDRCDRWSVNLIFNWWPAFGFSLRIWFVFCRVHLLFLTVFVRYCFGYAFVFHPHATEELFKITGLFANGTAMDLCKCVQQIKIC